MEVKLLELAADDGHVYKAIGFRETDISGSAQAAYDEGYAIGQADGKAEAEAKCKAEHFSAMFIGDGTNEVTLDMPFAPDVLLVSGFHPSGRFQEHAHMSISLDMRTFAQIAGIAVVYSAESGNFKQNVITAPTARNRVTFADGKVTIHDFTGMNSSTPGFFLKDMPYYVTAMKYTDMTDEELIVDYFSGLPDAGHQVVLSRAIIESLYPGASDGTNADWTALTATKPNWTFALS